MSKIYEALLRAELDRASGEPIPPDQAVVSNGASKAESPYRSPFSTTQALLDPLPLGTDTDYSRATEPFGAGSAQTLSLADLDLVAGNTWSPSLQQLPALEERGNGVEQFRSLRSRMHEFRDLNTLKSILVSSGLPQEGKSFVAANLAISFSRHKNSRVLLIDGDMRRCTLHKLLGTNCEPGLAEYLSGKATILQVMQRGIAVEGGAPLHPGLASLTFIGGGNDGDKAADLSGNRRFDELISAATPLFDWIVVDSSPVNLVADGVNLARACDGVLLVARGGITKFETAQRALSELKASKVLGFVLNAVENPPLTGGYYGYDGYDSVKE